MEDWTEQEFRRRIGLGDSATFEALGDGGHLGLEQ